MIVDVTSCGSHDVIVDNIDDIKEGHKVYISRIYFIPCVRLHAKSKGFKPYDQFTYPVKDALSNASNK